MAGLRDRLLDFCGHEPVLQLYKRLCRHHWDIDPAATADYIKSCREQWLRGPIGHMHPMVRVGFLF